MADKDTPADNQQQSHRSTGDVPPVVGEQYTDEDQQHPSDKVGGYLDAMKRRWRWRTGRWWNWSLVIEAGVLIAAVVYAYFTYGLLTSTRKALNESQAQTTILTEQVHAGQRAYLMVKNLRIESAGPLTVGSRMRLQWETTNVGQTPAQNLRTYYAFYVGPYEREPKPPQGTEHIYSEGRALGPSEMEESPDAPGVWLEGKPGRTLDAAELARLQSGSEYLNVRLIVAYDTVFPGVSGRTTLCAYYEGSRFSLCGLRGTHIQ